MRYLTLVALPLLAMSASPVLAKGCIRGAAAGGVGEPRVAHPPLRARPRRGGGRAGTHGKRVSHRTDAYARSLVVAGAVGPALARAETGP